MSAIDTLTERFRDFPGIGPRQARRFVYFLLSRNRSYLDELARLLTDIKNEIHICEMCFRFFNGQNKLPLCPICRNNDREKTQLLIVEKDIDLDAIEKSGAYRGLYFVLGGTIPILEKEPEKKVRLNELSSRISKMNNINELSEIIFAFSVNAEGEHTIEFLEQHLKNLLQDKPIKFSHLGRGVSTGAEVEYLDSDTIKNALKNRW
jgi:recombination protein RecR